MNTKSFIFLISIAPALYAMDQADQADQAEQAVALIDAFKAEKEFFDDTVNDWYKKITQKVAKTAGNQKSDYAQICKELSTSDLHELCSDPAIAKQITRYWAILSADQALVDAYTACILSESSENRTKQFTTFRRIGKTKITNLIKTEVSKDITSPETRPEKTFLHRLILSNNDVKLDDKQKRNLIALTVSQLIFWQIHRNIDEETDDPNLLLPKEITDPQKK